jgi:hypothetical protein
MEAEHMPYIGQNRMRHTLPLRQRLWENRPYCHHCGVLLSHHRDAEAVRIVGAMVLACNLCIAEGMPRTHSQISGSAAPAPEVRGRGTASAPNHSPTGTP